MGKAGSVDVRSASANEAELSRRMDRLEEKLSDIERRSKLAEWGYYAGRPSGNPREIERERDDFLLSGEVAAVTEQSAVELAEESLQRRLRLLRERVLCARLHADPEIYGLETVLAERLAEFVPKVNGQTIHRFDIPLILARESNRETRRQAWQCLEPLGEQMQREVVALFRRRNDLARAQGFRTYAEACLSLDSLTYDGLLETYVELEEATREPYQEFVVEAKDRLGVDALMPWDIDYALTLLAMPDPKHMTADGALKGIDEGLRRAGFEQGIHVARVDRASVPLGGVCYDIDAPEDIRVLVNPGDGLPTCMLLLHEFGHAEHFALIRQPGYLFRSERGSLLEGLGNTVQRLALDALWLSEVIGLPDDDVTQVLRGRRYILAHRIREMMSRSVLELKAYDDPEQDLATVQREALEGFLMAECGEGCSWAIDPFIILTPVYLQAYVIGEMIAGQNVERLRGLGMQSLLTQGFADFLYTHYFAPGNSIHWEDRIRSATGKNLSSRAIAQELAV